MRVEDGGGRAPRDDFEMQPRLRGRDSGSGHGRGSVFTDVEDVPEFFRRLWTFNPLNTIYNASGQPAISLPLHWNADGLPIGLMLGAAFGAEDVLFRLSAQLEAAQPWHDRHPPISAWNL